MSFRMNSADTFCPETTCSARWGFEPWLVAVAFVRAPWQRKNHKRRRNPALLLHCHAHRNLKGTKAHLAGRRWWQHANSAPGGRSWGPAGPTEIWRSKLAVPTEIWSSQLRPGSAHWDLALEVGSAHWDLELAVEARQCPLRSELAVEVRQVEEKGKEEKAGGMQLW